MAEVDSFKFENLINFRQIKGTRLYRCGRRPSVTEEEVKALAEKFGIKSFFDFRSTKDGSFAETSGDGLRPFYKAYKPCSVDHSTGEIADVDHGCGETSPGYHGNVFFLNIIPHMTDLVVSRMSDAMKLQLKDSVHKPNAHEIQSNLFHVILAKHGAGQMYKDLADYCGETFKIVLGMLNKPEHAPGIICCTLGKDRTGVMAAILNAIMGRSRQEIVDDFARTGIEQASYQNVIYAKYKELGVAEEDMDFGLAKPEYMEDFLDHIDKVYGSIPQYLEKIGFSLDEQEQLRKNIAA